MTTPPNPPPGNVPADREEYIEEVVTPGQVQQTHIVRDEATERYATITRLNQVLWLMFGLILGLIAVRFVLKLIGANPAAVFTQMVYGLSSVFLWPFTGILPDPSAGAFQFELSSVIAMIVYALLAWGITRLVWVFYSRSGATTQTRIFRRRQ